PGPDPAPAGGGRPGGRHSGRRRRDGRDLDRLDGVRPRRRRADPGALRGGPAPGPAESLRTHRPADRVPTPAGCHHRADPQRRSPEGRRWREQTVGGGRSGLRRRVRPPPTAGPFRTPRTLLRASPSEAGLGPPAGPDPLGWADVVLRELEVRELALVESAKVTFGSGLNLLTGETGSGKSL